MRKSKFTESQIVGILGEGEAGLPVAELKLARALGEAITQSQFKQDMPVIFAALTACWEKAYQA